jgi:hypothetical protein
MMPKSPPIEAVRLLNGFRGYQLVVAACRLKLPDLVSSGNGDPVSLASQTSTHEPSLRRVLRALAAWGFFAQGDDGRYVPTPISEAFRSDKPGLRNMALMLSEEAYRAWGELTYTLESGQPAFERVYGMSRWAKLAAEPEHAAQFNAAMVESTNRVMHSFLAAYDFGRVRNVVDVGGGSGALLAAVLSAHPKMEGVLFDLASGLSGAAEAIERAGLGARVRIVEGSFFESVPQAADLYMLKSVIHDWNDDDAVNILKTCRAAMARDSRVVLVERLVPERVAEGDGSLATVMSDVNMMVVLGGRERTTAEYASLLEAAGLRMSRPIAMDSDFYAIEALPS